MSNLFGMNDKPNVNLHKMSRKERNEAFNLELMLRLAEFKLLENYDKSYDDVWKETSEYINEELYCEGKGVVTGLNMCGSMELGRTTYKVVRGFNYETPSYLFSYVSADSSDRGKRVELVRQPGTSRCDLLQFEVYEGALSSSQLCDIDIEF